MQQEHLSAKGDQLCEEFRREKIEALRRLHNTQMRISEVE